MLTCIADRPSISEDHTHLKRWACVRSGPLTSFAGSSTFGAGLGPCFGRSPPLLAFSRGRTFEMMLHHLSLDEASCRQEMQHLLHQLGCMVSLQVNTLEQTRPRSPCTINSRGRMCDVFDLATAWSACAPYIGSDRCRRQSLAGHVSCD